LYSITYVGIHSGTYGTQMTVGKTPTVTGPKILVCRQTEPTATWCFERGLERRQDQEIDIWSFFCP
jgi:hypothetical protein